MKKGALNFLGRKNQSLFDTNIKIKDMDKRELVLESSAIPESGTASVRARPTVKHHNSSSFESFQGLAVPTPKVPLLPPVNGLKNNGSVGGDSLSSGSVISVPDLVEGEIFVPPPPSMAPPPPPGSFVLPPPDFMGDLNSPDLKNLQSLPMSTPKPTPLSLSVREEDFTFLKPPPMAPPKPPSTCSSGSTSSLPISKPPVPEHPKFAPPPPPSDRQQKTYKTPPPKPTRLSSIPTLDSPPQTPAPPPPVQTPTLSSFNPQNTAKLYNVPKTSFLGGFEDCKTKPRQMLLLEDSGSVKSAPVLVQVDGKVSKMATPPKPVSKDVQELKDNLHIAQLPLPDPNNKAKTRTVSAPLETDEPLRTLHQTSPLLQKVNSTSVDSESSKDKLGGSQSQRLNFSPLLDRKLRNLKSSETNAAREGTVASPLALLMAAKKREKHRSSQILSQENSLKKNEKPSASIRPNDSSPNSFIVTPKIGSPTSQTFQNIAEVSPKSASSVPHTQTIQTQQKPSSPTAVKDQMLSSSLKRMAKSLSATDLVTPKQNSEHSLTKSQQTQHEDEDKEELNIPLLPPPPEFDDIDATIGPPPSIPPPDPPMNKVPTQNVSQLSTAKYPSPPPKPKPLKAPKLMPPDTHVKPRPQVQTKPVVPSSQLPTPLSPSQATLLSILQKKMLEMDQKMAPVKEAESSSDDWSTPLSDENNKVPADPKFSAKNKNDPLDNKAALDMQELETKVLKNYQETSSIKFPTSNGLQSKHQYGMTFTVRPGTKQPITLVSKGES